MISPFGHDLVSAGGAASELKPQDRGSARRFKAPIDQQEDDVEHDDSDAEPDEQSLPTDGVLVASRALSGGSDD